MHDQTRWAAGGAHDREEAVEDEGADEGAEYVTSLGRFIPPTKGDANAAKIVRGFLQRVKRDGTLGQKVPVTAICIPAREDSR